MLLDKAQKERRYSVAQFLFFQLMRLSFSFSFCPIFLCVAPLINPASIYFMMTDRQRETERRGAISRQGPREDNY